MHECLWWEAEHPRSGAPPPDSYDTVQVLTVILVGAERGNLKEEVGSVDKTCLFFQKKSASGLTLVFVFRSRQSQDLRIKNWLLYIFSHCFF